MNMKGINIFVLGITFLLLCGCDDFLEEKSQDEVRPSTVTDMEKILEGEAYFNKTEGFMFNFGTDVLSDNINATLLMMIEMSEKNSKHPVSVGKGICSTSLAAMKI